MKHRIYLIHDHLLSPPAALPSLDNHLEKLEVLDVSILLNTVDEVLDLCFSHLAAQVAFSRNISDSVSARISHT